MAKTFKINHFKPTSIRATEYSNAFKMYGVNFDHFYRMDDVVGNHVAITFPNDFSMRVSYSGSGGWNGYIQAYTQNSTGTSPKGYSFRVADGGPDSHKEWRYDFKRGKTYKFTIITPESGTKKVVEIIEGGFIVDQSSGKIKTQGNINNKIVKSITDSSHGKLTFGDKWRHVVNNIDGVSNTISVKSGTTFNFYKNGYIVNRDGNNNAYTQAFEYSPLHLKYVKHWDHAVGHEQTLLDLDNFDSGDGRDVTRKQYKFLVRICSGVAPKYMGNLPGIYGASDAYLEFSWFADDGLSERGPNLFIYFKLVKVVKHREGVNFYPNAVNQLTVGKKYRITDVWKQIGSVNANLRNSYWAQWFIKYDNGAVKIGMKCDFHGADRSRFAFFAPTDLWVTDESQVEIAENCGLSSARGKFVDFGFNQGNIRSFGVLPTQKDSILVSDSLSNWRHGNVDPNKQTNAFLADTYATTNIKQSISNSGINVPETGWRACKFSWQSRGLFCLNKNIDDLLYVRMSDDINSIKDHYDFTGIKKVTGLKQKLKAAGATDEDVINLRDIAFSGERVYFLTNKSLFSAKVMILSTTFTDFKKESALGSTPNAPHPNGPHEWWGIGIVPKDIIVGAHDAARDIFISSTYPPHWMEGKVDEKGNLLFLEKFNFGDVGIWNHASTCISFDSLGYCVLCHHTPGVTGYLNQACLVKDMIKLTGYDGEFLSDARERAFKAITTTITYGAFMSEHLLTKIALNDVTSIGGGAFEHCDGLKHIEIKKATTIGDYAFYGVHNDAHIWINGKFNTVAEKDRIFGSGKWSSLTFHWVNDDGTPWVDPNIQTFKGSFSDESQKNRFLAITDRVPNAAFDSERALTGITLPLATNIGQYSFRWAPLTYIRVPKATFIGYSAFAGIVNAHSTTVMWSYKLEIITTKNLIFGGSHWENVKFRLFDDNGVLVPEAVKFTDNYQHLGSGSVNLPISGIQATVGHVEHLFVNINELRKGGSHYLYINTGLIYAQEGGNAVTCADITQPYLKLQYTRKTHSFGYYWKLISQTDHYVI